MLAKKSVRNRICCNASHLRTRRSISEASQHNKQAMFKKPVTLSGT
jgi:hypothetical protein